MNATKIGHRVFELKDQLEFADMSGDYNPIHIDPVEARRTLVGMPVLHGCHGVLWLIESLCAVRSLAAFQRIEAVFYAPAYLDCVLEAHMETDGPDTILSLKDGGTVLTRLRLVWGSVEAIAVADDALRPHPEVPKQRPASVRFEEMAAWSADQDLHWDPALGRIRFPSLVDTSTGRGLIALFGTLSRLVGMECPGQNSLFSKILVSPSAHMGQMHARVISARNRVAPVVIEAEGAGVLCRIEAFCRPEPTQQPHFNEIRAVVPVGSSAGVNALIIGGSRGLGEVTAKIIAAGGGRVAVGYHVGGDDAERVVAEIRAGGQEAIAVQFDAANSREALDRLENSGFQADHLYYFATSRISARRISGFDRELYESFLRIFVEGFVNTVRRASDDGRKSLRAFYPSSVFVGNKMAKDIEYVAAKTAGEAVCRAFQNLGTDPQFGLSILVERLPRTATDQTASILGGHIATAMEVMLPIVAKMTDGYEEIDE